MNNVLMNEIDDLNDEVSQSNDKEVLIPCAICGEFLVTVEMMDNSTNEVKQAMVCTACWNNDVIAIGHFIFGKYSVCE